MRICSNVCKGGGTYCSHVQTPKSWNSEYRSHISGHLFMLTQQEFTDVGLGAEAHGAYAHAKSLHGPFA